MSGRQAMSVTWRDPHGVEAGDRSRAFCSHKMPGTGDHDERVFGFRVHVQRECGVGGNSGNNQREMAADWPVKWQRSTCERVSAGFRYEIRKELHVTLSGCLTAQFRWPRELRIVSPRRIIASLFPTFASFIKTIQICIRLSATPRHA